MESTAGKRLQQWREFKGLSLTELFRLTGIKVTTLSTAEQPGSSNPSYDTITKLLAAFPDLSADWLLLGTGPMLRDGRALAAAKPLAYATAEPTLAAEPAPAYGAACVAPVAVVTLTAEVTELRVENKELKAELKQARREAREDLVAQARLYNSVKEDQDGLINRLYAKVDEYELRLGIRQPTVAERERMSSEAPRMEVLPFGERYRATPATAQEPQAVADDEPGCVLRALYPEGYSYLDAA